MSMVILFLALAILGVHGLGNDFDYSSHGIDFIFHDYHNLLLIVNGNNCYFAQMDDVTNPFLEKDRGDVLKELFIRIARGVVVPTTLDDMRERYSDLLADFHCAGKDTYTVDFSIIDIVMDPEENVTATLFGIDVVFHQEHGLFLVIRNESCYFSTAPPEVDQDFFQSAKDEIVMEAARAIFNEPVQASSLQEMESQYGDLVAELDCLGKSVFALNMTMEKVVQNLETKENSNFLSNGYKLYFHNNTNLLVTMHERTCYFAQLSAGMVQEKWRMCPQVVFNEARRVIDEGPAWRTTLQTMREMYHDPLASFECANMDIYAMTLNDTLVEDTACPDHQ